MLFSTLVVETGLKTCRSKTDIADSEIIKKRKRLTLGGCTPRSFRLNKMQKQNIKIVNSCSKTCKNKRKISFSKNYSTKTLRLCKCHNVMKPKNISILMELELKLGLKPKPNRKSVITFNDFL